MREDGELTSILIQSFPVQGIFPNSFVPPPLKSNDNQLLILGSGILLTLTWSELCLEYPQLSTQVSRGVGQGENRTVGRLGQQGRRSWPRADWDLGTTRQSPEGHVIAVERVGRSEGGKAEET